MAKLEDGTVVLVGPEIPKPNSSCVGCEHMQDAGNGYHWCTVDDDLLITVMDNRELCPLGET